MRRRLTALTILSIFSMAASTGSSAFAAPTTATVGSTVGTPAAAVPGICGAEACAAVQLTATSGAPAVAPFDGVVVGWKVKASQAIAARLRTVQPGLANTYVATATGATEQVPGDGGEHRYGARVPIAAGGRLALDGIGLPQAFLTAGGANGHARIGYDDPSGDTFNAGETKTSTAPQTGQMLVAAELEPDEDGDGYGDVTQDACVANAADHTAPCDGTRTFGSPLTLGPDRRGFSPFGGPFGATQGLAAGTIASAPAGGILTAWRFRAAPSDGPTVLQLLRPAGGGSFKVVAESAATSVSAGNAMTLGAQVPVQAGDVLAARSASGDLGALAAVAGDTLAIKKPPALSGETWTPAPSASDHFRLLAQADVEPDLDGNGRGDVTQDRADLEITGSAPAEVGAAEGWAHTYTVRNVGPDAAQGVRVVFGGGTYGGAGAACVADVASSGAPGPGCTIGTLAPGATTTVTAGFVEAAIHPSLPGVRASTATVSASTIDPVPGNGSASLRTNVLPYVPPQLPQVPFVLRPCTNVIRGTRDDDVLRGTLFGDRLVGNDGDDLLKGSGADDCLEGGAGNDVLDGGDGNDRLAGSAGKDRMTGGAGSDKLTGGRGNDRLTGGPGHDTISPGDGKDLVFAGGGNDTINAVDGVKETIDCGAGKDTVRADRRDRLKGCEKKTRR
jgi:Ca2+-binding RTX toxin-like protein